MVKQFAISPTVISSAKFASYFPKKLSIAQKESIVTEQMKKNNSQLYTNSIHFVVALSYVAKWNISGEKDLHTTNVKYWIVS